MNHTELNNKITTTNASTNFHTVNLSKLVTNLEDKNQKFINNKFANITNDHKNHIPEKTSTNLNNINNNKLKINSTFLIPNANNRHLNNISIIKDVEGSAVNIKPNVKPISTKKKPVLKRNLSLIEDLKTKSNKDPVIAFFNRNFYSCEIPVPKKISDSQKILDYYLKDKETKEKYKLLLRLNKYSSNNKYRMKSLNLEKNTFKKNDIKKSLMLDNFKIYNRIHQIVRFWSKFINYACPIFQVQKFTLNSLKYKNDNNNNNDENGYDDYSNKNNSQNKIIKLPKLYTNSSKVFKIGKTKQKKFLRRNRSLDFDNSSNYIKLIEKNN